MNCNVNACAFQLSQATLVKGSFNPQRGPLLQQYPPITFVVCVLFVVCDSWKKKYFDTKKVTASLEEVLTKLREDLELYYKKLLMQLEAREIKMRPRNLANISDSKVLKLFFLPLEKSYAGSML